MRIRIHANGMMRTIALMVSWTGLAWGSLAQGSEKPRVALVATAMNADSEKFLDLALVELTQRGDIELVERQEIRKVLGEQEQALQQADAGMAAGKLLRADVVGVLETTPDGKEAGGFAVLDTATGVSYWNQGVDQQSVETVAGEVVKGLAVALEKRSRAGTLSTVCMLGARNAEFPRTMDVFCETVAYLLDRQMVANPSVTTLDRRRLEAVISENNLPGVESQKELLLPSLRLVELDFRRGAATNEVKILVRVTDSAGTVLAQPEVTGSQNAVELTDRLQLALTEVLHAKPQEKKGNRAEEADRFRVQGHILWKRGLPEQAIRALDAAYALDPGSPEDMTAYIGILVDRAYSLAYDKDCEHAIELMLRILDIEERHHIWHPEAGGQNSDRFLSAAGKCKLSVLNGLPKQQEFDELRHRYQRILGLTTNPAETNQVLAKPKYRDSFDGVPAYYSDDCSDYLQFRATSARVLCLNSDEFYRILNSRLDGWLQREADPSQPHDAAIIYTLNDLIGKGYQQVWESRGWIPFDEDYVRGMRELSRRLSEHPRLIVKLEGRYFSMLIDQCLAERGGPEVTQNEYVSEADKIMALALEGTSAQETPPGDIPVLYEMAARFVEADWVQWQIGSKKEWTDAHLHQIAMTMFDNHHIAGNILLMMEHLQVDFEKYRKPLLWRLNAVQNNRSYKRYDLSQQYLKDLLLALPAPSVPGTATASTGGKMEVLWQTPAPDDWQNRLVGLHIDDEQTLYAYAGYQGNSQRTDNPLIQLVRLDLSTGQMDTFGKIRVNACWGEQLYYMGPTCSGEFIEDSACSDTHLWLATSRDGLYGVSLKTDGSDPIHIRMADGLPSDNIHSVLPIGDTLYIGCGQDGGDGYLLRYHLLSRQFEVMVSTMRASPETPLDSLPNGFHLQKIMYDEPRNRLLLMVNGQQGETDGTLWEYRLEDGVFRELLKMDWPAREVKVGADGVIELYVNRVLTPQYVFYYGIVEFDPATDKGRMVFVNQKRGASEKLPLNADTLRYRNILFRSNVLGDGWLYHWGFKQITGAEWYELRRVNLLTGEVQEVPGQAAIVTDPWGTPAWQRVNIYYWGWLRWLPRSRLLIIGNGGQFTAVKVEK